MTDKAEKSKETKEIIKKNAVVGFAVCVALDHEFADKKMFLRPLIFSWQCDETNAERGNDTIQKDVQVSASLNAPPGTFEIMGLMPSGYYQHLGYEYPGIEHPDWKEELERVKSKQ
nr:hypothetical protein [Candidatus Sigynarchaeota archaeon]